MNKVTLNIKNFKCFKEQQIELNNLTVFLGANAVGKSSILQSLVLLFRAKLLSNELKDVDIPLYKGLGYDWGFIENIYSNNAIDKQIEISLGGESLTIDIDENEKLTDTAKAKLRNPIITEYSYLCAERVGPRNIVEYNTSERYCGTHGEYTAYIIQKNQNEEIIKDRCLDPNKKLFIDQLNDWINFIFPNINIKVEIPFYKLAQISVIKGGNNLLPTHIGFGLSYLLPILVDALVLPKSSWFIVENPEAHLQPAAQTKIGYFLARMSAAGLKIVVETHSEHVLKGMAAVELPNDKKFVSDNISVYIVENVNNTPIIKEVSLQREGVAKNDFPSDFFDYGKTEIQKDLEPFSQKLNDIGNLLK